MSRGLYIHIPFCKSKCHYCNFISLPDPAPELRRRYFLCLFKEIEQAREKYGKLAFSSIYLGGGTPSILTISEMTELFNSLREAFVIDPGAEITCEWNPGDHENNRIETFAALGVNRVSLGAQSFDDRLLKRLGRRHRTRDTIVTLDRARGAGITNISVDLMLRLPGQTVENFRDSLHQVTGLDVTQVSLYDLEMHEETVFGRLQKENKLALPTENVHAGMYDTAIHALTRAGYEHYEISNFAKPGFASRHNLTYWRNQEYLGLGPGSFSYLEGIRYEFSCNMENYLRKCEALDWTNDIEDVLSPEEKERESFVTGLRLREGVYPCDFPLTYYLIRERVLELVDEGLMEFQGDVLRLMNRGKFLSEEVFRFLLQKEESV